LIFVKKLNINIQNSKKMIKNVFIIMCVTKSVRCLPMNNLSSDSIVYNARIGVNPDGSPVVYDQNKLLEENRNKAAEKIRTEAMQQRMNYPQFVEYDDKLGQSNVDLVRTPEVDEFYSAEPKMITAKIPPKIEDAVVDTLAGMIRKYGPEVVLFLFAKGWDTLFPPKDVNNEQQPSGKESKVTASNEFNEVA
jgi:endonuclease/exonuclease/phosphatase (EEP) superfamily protein YafD